MFSIPQIVLNSYFYRYSIKRMLGIYKYSVDVYKPLQ